MALPSQVERNVEMSRPIMSRGGGKGGLPMPVMIGAGVLVLAAGGFAAYKYWPAPAAANAQPSLSESNASKPLTNSAPANNNVTSGSSEPANVTPPVSIRQGTSTVSGANTGTPGSLTNPSKTGNSTTPSTLGDAFSQGQPHTTPASTPGNVTNPAGESSQSNSTPGSGSGAGMGAGDGTPPTPAVEPVKTSQTRTFIEEGDRALAANKLVNARIAYSKALLSSDATKVEQDALRQRLTAINEDLVFSPKVTPEDQLTETYTVVAGDALERIRRKRELTTEWMLIQRVNKLASPNSLKIGQKLKLVRGPFHAVITKSDYRLDLFTGSPDEPERWLYIRSFNVGLGTDNGTPVGTFTIRNKMQNPEWRNPRTGEFFDREDPKIPIGEYWLGWEGLGDSAPITGYGLHGTVDPQSVGKQMSMGCARLLDEDIKLLYELLATKVSIIKVVP